MLSVPDEPIWKSVLCFSFRWLWLRWGPTLLPVLKFRSRLQTAPSLCQWCPPPNLFPGKHALTASRLADSTRKNAVYMEQLCWASFKKLPKHTAVILVMRRASRHPKKQTNPIFFYGLLQYRKYKNCWSPTKGAEFHVKKRKSKWS